MIRSKIKINKIVVISNEMFVFLNKFVVFIWIFIGFVMCVFNLFFLLIFVVKELYEMFFFICFLIVFRFFFSIFVLMFFLKKIGCISVVLFFDIIFCRVVNGNLCKGGVDVCFFNGFFFKFVVICWIDFKLLVFKFEFLCYVSRVGIFEELGNFFFIRFLVFMEGEFLFKFGVLFIFVLLMVG